MENRTRHAITGRSFFGLALIILGLVVLLNNLDVIYVDHISRYWPALFILFGVVKLTESDRTNQRGNGIGWIFLGAWLLISMNGWFGLRFHDSWPILIIGFGVSMLWKAFYRQPQLNIAEEHHHGN